MSLAARRALAAYLVAIIARLERLWPRCFVVYEGRISLQPAGSPHVEKERPSANPQFANGRGTSTCMGTIMSAAPPRK